jgi:D-alanyl-D-alanine carboxypeptidase
MLNANKITIEHLLYHRSGLYNITKEDGFHTWISKPRKRREMLKKMVENGVDFEPDAKKEYSNTNYILLSYIAEEIDKKSFAKILKKRIINPLNLTNTHFGKEINLKKNEATSYYWEDSKWNPIIIETNLKGPMGAGAIVSTAKELTIFYTGLFFGKLLSKESLQKMTSPKDEMGMGISVINYKGALVYGHDGGIDGFRSMAVYIPTKNLAMAFTFNASGVSTTGTIIKILETYFKDDEKLQSKSLIKLVSTDLDKYLGVYSGKTFPAKVTFTKKGNTLFAKATGQPMFKLIAIEKSVFKYDAMGIVFSFDSSGKTVSVKFGGKNHLLSKK